MASMNNAKTEAPWKIRRVVSAIPKKRQELLRWNGWGYNDSGFDNHRNELFKFNGNRYPMGSTLLPEFTDYLSRRFNLNVTKEHLCAKPPPEKYPDCVLVDEFMAALKEKRFSYSLDGMDRLIRSHGQTVYEIKALYEGNMVRIPDVVVWPESHEDVEVLVRLATQFNVVVIPYGGGTAVTGATTCPEREKRSIVALDTSQMNRLLSLDKETLVARFEAGIVGQDLERELRGFGLKLGHEPDSMEFSTLGGWVATRASGMKKNKYGNIEDLVLGVRMVTAKGALERNTSAPRISCGPDFNHIVLGSEGTLGVVTEVVLKVRPEPPVKRYGSMVFPRFSSGVRCMREIALRRCQPASIRLADNEQVQFALVLKPQGWLLHRFVNECKMWGLKWLLGYDSEQISVATMVYEGEEEDVKRQEKLVLEIAKRHGGLQAGATNGKRGYMVTYVVAYLRDVLLRYGMIGESFETSVAWDRCEELCEKVKKRIRKECEAYSITFYHVSCRVTQLYDTGAAVYFYFGFNFADHPNYMQIHTEIESRARDECLANGGTISHHHGVGKLRSHWYPQSVSALGVDLYKATKRELDPMNIFAVGNLLSEEGEDGEVIEGGK